MATLVRERERKTTR